MMEDAGIHVVYGFVGLKTHCKCCLVVRREEDGLCRYAHLGTGNYHTKTARLYTDLSFMTKRPEITAEVAQIFNTLTGFSKNPEFKQLLVAPYTLHKRMNQFITQEARNAKRGLEAKIIVKCNSLIDKETIDNLYAASRAGVQIDLHIRGICGLVPGIKGMSENIRVRSLLGRYLEHSRIYYFQNAQGKQPLIYAGSADWMARNFYRRIEVIFPIIQDDLRQRIIESILPTYLVDNKAATQLRPNGSYKRVPKGRNESDISAQQVFTEEAVLAAKAAEIAMEVDDFGIPETGAI